MGHAAAEDVKWCKLDSVRTHTKKHYGAGTTGKYIKKMFFVNFCFSYIIKDFFFILKVYQDNPVARTWLNFKRAPVFLDILVCQT